MIPQFISYFLCLIDTVRIKRGDSIDFKGVKLLYKIRKSENDYTNSLHNYF